MKSFNIAGPCRPEMHYMIRPDNRIPGIERLIDDMAYFVVHAPRQTGKTTTLAALARRLTEEGRYAALHVSCETARVFDEVEPAERRIWLAVEMAGARELPVALRPPPAEDAPASGLMSTQLQRWAESCPRPVVLFFDEIDSLQRAPLTSVLSQLREGYPNRPEHFPWSIVLCGMRDVRDYKENSLRLANFTRDQLVELYQQHTVETGQVFTAEALERAWAISQGQPWLANALAREVIREMEVPLDQPITAEHIDAARERLILARATHLDSLLARLQEDRVRRILEPILVGELAANDPLDDEYTYVRDLGLIRPGDPPQIANPLYREVILRVLAAPAERSIPEDTPGHIDASGRLNLSRLMADFLRFWCDNGDVMVTRMPYPEAAPMLVLMAWLHRAVNGKGLIDRELGIGRKRVDLLVRWPCLQDGQRHWQREAIELKVWRDRDRRGDPEPAGLAQLDTYLSKLGLDTGWLVIFDARKDAPDVDLRAQIRTAKTPSGRTVNVMRA